MAGDGKAALAILEASNDFDLLLTDLALPGGMNGAELANIASARYPSLGVLTTSGYNSPEISGSGLEQSQWRPLHKPFRWIELAKVIEKLFE